MDDIWKRKLQKIQKKHLAREIDRGPAEGYLGLAHDLIEEFLIPDSGEDETGEERYLKIVFLFKNYGDDNPCCQCILGVMATHRDAYWGWDARVATLENKCGNICNVPQLQNGDIDRDAWKEQIQGCYRNLTGLAQEFGLDLRQVASALRNPRNEWRLTR